MALDHPQGMISSVPSSHPKRHGLAPSCILTSGKWRGPTFVQSRHSARHRF